MMRWFFYIMAAICLAAAVASAAIGQTDIQLTLAAVFFVGSLNCLAFAILLGRKKGRQGER